MAMCVCFEWIRMGCQDNNKCLVICAELLDSIMKVCSCSDLQGYFLNWLWLISDFYRNGWVVIMGNISNGTLNIVKRDHILR